MSDPKVVTIRYRTIATGIVVVVLIVGAFFLGRSTAQPDWESIAAKVRDFRGRERDDEAPPGSDSGQPEVHD
jgi:hypothetical protein